MLGFVLDREIAAGEQLAEWFNLHEFAVMSDFQGRSPKQILANPIEDHSSWHFFQARSWLDYAMRENAPSAIHYAAFELRYGVEYLLFELVVLTGELLTLREYQQAIGDPKEMKRMLASPSRNYAKLSEFVKILVSIDAHAPVLQFWNLEDLFRYWGVASEFLHFVGAHQATYVRPDWVAHAISRLDSILNEIWTAITGTIGKAMIRPSEMEPEVHQAWTEFADGTLSETDLAQRLRIMQPGLQARRGEAGWRFVERRIYKSRAEYC